MLLLEVKLVLNLYLLDVFQGPLDVLTVYSLLIFDHIFFLDIELNILVSLMC